MAILGVILAVAVCASLVYMVFFYRKRFHTLTSDLEAQHRYISRMQQDMLALNQKVDMLSKGNRGMGRRLMVVEKQRAPLTLVEDEPTQDSIDPSSPEFSKIKQTAGLFEQGIAEDNSIEDAEETLSEAKLANLFRQGQV